jgi:hypothetical protein
MESTQLLLIYIYIYKKNLLNSFKNLFSLLVEHFSKQILKLGKGGTLLLYLLCDATIAPGAHLGPHG